MKRFFFCFSFSFLVLAIGCSKGGGGDTSVNPNITPLPQVNITKDGNISISKDALGKEFLLQASFINENGGQIFGSPTSRGTQSRVIFFKQQKDSLFMMESTEGLLASGELPSERILAEFKIVEDKDDKIAFDFNEGMKNIFMAGDWYGSDFGSGPPSQQAVDISHSFLKTAENQKNRILIRQIAQVELRNYVLPVEVVYYLEPYQPDPAFKPVLSPGFDKMGFFEANPTVRPEFGSLRNTISKWLSNKPIVYHISSNTPEEFRDAVKQGVLYWNKTFGTEVVQVEMAPEGISAPNPDYNMIQWVTNHAAGLAYADAQMDPRTGQILHAQIYFTSTFGVQAIDDLDRKKKGNSEDDNLQLGLKGFSSGLLCDYSTEEDFSDLISLDTANKKIPLRLAQDYVRDVVAHEVGHTLGLRHNFAGSASSDLKPSEVSKNFETYLKTGELKNPKRVASSVMDYLPHEEAILNGAYIGSDKSEPLPYDAMAIQWAYYGMESKQDLATVLFCTDSNMAIDCARFDRSSHPILAAADSFEQGVDNLPKQIARRYLMTKDVFDPEKRKSIDKVALDAQNTAQDITEPLYKFLNLLKSDFNSPIFAVEKKFPTITDVNRDEVDKAILQWMDEAIASGGGVKTLLSLIDKHAIADVVKNYPSEFNSIVDNPNFREGTTVLGEPYKFSDDEIKKMKSTAAAFFDLLEDKMMWQVTQIISAPQQRRQFCALFSKPMPGCSLLAPQPTTFQRIADIKGLEDTLGNWAQFIIVDGAEKKPTFDDNLRLLATDILKPTQGPTPEWQKENRERVLKLLLSKLEQRYGMPVDKVDAKTLSDKDRKVLEGERRIVEALSLNPKNPPPPPVPLPQY